MEVDLLVGAPAKLFEGDGGSYFAWPEGEHPILVEAKVGAGKVLLRPFGLGFPRFADSSKVALVLQGD